MKKWLLKLWLDGVRYRSLRWAIPIILPGHHVGRNGSGRRKSVQKAAKEYYQKEEERQNELP